MSEPRNTAKPGAGKENGRLFYFDFLRALACMLVIMVHVSSPYALQQAGSADFWIGNFFDSVSRIGVPLFVMISGALMLDERYAFTRKKWLGHIGRMLLFFAFWSTAYALVYQIASPIAGGGEVDLSAFIWAVLKGHTHLWFIPMITGLYLLLPLLRLWIRRQNQRYVEYFLALALAFAFVLPHAARVLACFNAQFEQLFEIIGNINLQHAACYVSYFVLGWYLHNFDLRRKKLLYALGLISLFVTCAGTYLLITRTGDEAFVFYDVFSANVLLPAAAAFVLARSALAGRQNRAPMLHRAANCISKYSLGVYAVHVAVLAVCMRFSSGMAPWIGLPLNFLLCLLISLPASMIISRIPVLRKLV